MTNTILTHIDTKSRRVQMLMQPSLYRKAKEVSAELGLSLNEFMHRAIEEATCNGVVRYLVATKGEQK